MKSPEASKKRGPDGSEDIHLSPKRLRPRKDPNASPKPPEDLNAPKRAPGRPRKDLNATPKRGRGRPPKDPNPAPTAKSGVPGRGPRRASKASTTPTAPQRKSKAPTKSTTPASRTKRSPTKSGPLPKYTTLAQFLGTYNITCGEVEGNWPDVAKDMRISIHSLPRTNSALIAYFNLGILEGTMLLAADTTTLERVHKQVAATDSANIDRSPSSGSKDGILYFVWRGQDVDDADEVHPGTGSKQSGTLKFNAEDMSFQGVGSFPSLGSECSFRGTKISNEGSDEPEPWSTYSMEAYEDASRARWG